MEFVPTEFLCAIEPWVAAAALPPLSPVIQTALQCEGLLTTALQNAYQEPAAVECRRQTTWTEAQAGSGLRRDVFIKTGDTVRVTAATLMPQAVLNRYPWLAAMGNNPLGAMLEKHARYERGAFEFATVDAGMIVPASLPSTLWARRYRFFLTGGELLVTEIFLANVLERLGASLL